MTNKKPDCADFILAAARKIRVRPNNLTPNTSAGVSISRIYALAQSVYTANEFCLALQALIDKDFVLVTVESRFYRRGVSGAAPEWLDCRGAEKITKFPDTAAFDEYPHWVYNEQQDPVDPDTVVGDFTEFVRAVLHIKADGLSKKAQKLDARRGVKAEDIISSMNNQKLPLT